jgi:NAD-dependent isocitrate dehydrogenase
MMKSEAALEGKERAGAQLTTVALIPGDGIGPEIAAAVRKIFDAAGTPIAWEEHQAGLNSLDVAPNGLPASTLEAIKKLGIALKGPTATPAGGGHKSVNVTIRKSLELYANVRPIKTLPGVPTRYENVDMVIVRENVEDTYGGIEHMQTPDVAQCLKVITRQGCEAIARYAFELARSWGRKRVTCLHKANIHKITDGLFLECFKEVAASYPDVEADDMLVDAACMNLVTKPERFDVLVMPNLYGDIVSDLAAGLVGGLGVASGGNIGKTLAVFEAVHGTAPDIAGQNLANPTALLMSGTQMLRHLGHVAHAERIEAALFKALGDGIKTKDLGGSAGTDAFTDAVIAALSPEVAPVAAATPRQISHVVPAATAAAPKAITFAGADVFVQHGPVPAMPERVGPFTLKMISNRGTKVWPGEAPDILLVDWYRCRYVADGQATDAQLLELLGEVGKHYPWMHVEKLLVADGKALYSKAQGE